MIEDPADALTAIRLVDAMRADDAAWRHVLAVVLNEYDHEVIITVLTAALVGIVEGLEEHTGADVIEVVRPEVEAWLGPLPEGRRHGRRRHHRGRRTG